MPRFRAAVAEVFATGTVDMWLSEPTLEFIKAGK